jgi:hypothetical protein
MDSGKNGADLEERARRDLLVRWRAAIESMKAEAGEDEGNENVQSAAWGHLPWLSTLVLFLLVIVKLSAVAHFDITTTMRLVQASSPIDIVFGVLSANLGSVALAVFLVFLFALHRVQRLSSFDHGLLIGGAALFGFIAALMGSWFHALGVLLLADTAYRGWVPRLVAWSWKRVRQLWRDKRANGGAVLERSREEDEKASQKAEAKGLGEQIEQLLEITDIRTADLKEVQKLVELQERFSELVVSNLRRLNIEVDRLEASHRKVRGLELVVVATYTSLTAVLPFFLPIPWLPAERIESVSEGFTGYVLSEEGGSLVILEDGTRRIVRIGKAGVQRELCLAESPRRTTPIVGLGYTPPAYPRCSDLVDEAPAPPGEESG